MDASAPRPPVPPSSSVRAAVPASGSRRIIAAILLVAVVATGLAVHTLLPDTAATDIAGDLLYASAVYAGLVVVFPRWVPLLTGAVAAAWCIAIELFQLTGIPVALGAEFLPAMLVLGTVFDPRDLLVYVVTIVLVAAVDAVVRVVARRAS